MQIIRFTGTGKIEGTPHTYKNEKVILGRNLAVKLALEAYEKDQDKVAGFFGRLPMLIKEWL